MTNTTKQIIDKKKPDDVQPGTYIEYGVEHNGKNPKFKNGDRKRKPKYKNIFSKSYCENLSEESFVIKEIKNGAPWTFVINFFSLILIYISQTYTYINPLKNSFKCNIKKPTRYWTQP